MKIIAHRGASGDAPENTLAAFRLAWDMDADGIELDVRLSQDARIMAHHDLSTLRTAGVDFGIAATHSTILRELDVGGWRGQRFAGEKIPFLEEVLDTVPPHGQVLIELKCDPGIAPVLHPLLNRVAPLKPRIALISFRLDTLLACRAALPDIPCYLIKACEPPDGQDRHLPHPPDLIALARRHRLTGLDPDYRGISAEFAAAVREAGLQLMTWTVNDVAEARRLYGLGLAAITTDYPARMRQAVA